ncbi:MAG: helix-turn-helix transcriptional regulator [Clostridia bacterium]|nr:helix-turn-helix transcriptional regulator [Clostridia bacterium]
MNQILIGKYIARKRKEKNLTQAQLAERLNVSNKTISKWENGNCMPDYSVIEILCRELDITISELMDGEDAKTEVNDKINNVQLMFLIRKMQELEKQNKLTYGFLIVVMGIALLSLSRLFDGSNAMDFFSGLFLGLSIVTMLTGVYFIGKNLRR